MSMRVVESGNRPLDQWKTTELKEELKRRKMTTGGLKADLVRRLEDAMRNEEPGKVEEMDSDVEEENPNKGIAPENHRSRHHDKDEESEISHKNKNPRTGNKDQSVEQQNPSGMDIDNDNRPAENDANPNNEYAGRVSPSKNSCEEELKPEVSDSRGSGVEAKEEEGAVSKNLQVSEKVRPVDIGFQVKCESVSTDSVSINEENELKVSLNVDNYVNLESEVVVKRRNTMQESLKYDDDVPQHVGLGGNDSESLAQQSQAGDGPKERGIKHDHDDDGGHGTCILNDQGGLVEAQGGTNSLYEEVAKNLAQKLGDGDAETLQNDEKIDVISGPLEYKMEIKNEDEIPVVKSLREDEGSDSMAIDICHDEKEKEGQGKANDVLRGSGEKRKKEDQEGGLQEPLKRVRRWNVVNNVAGDAPKVSITERERPASSTVMQDRSSTSKPIMSRSDSMKNGNSEKERIVPPSLKYSSNSLRIDRFLRPFTLKAVKELLAKTGTVTNFWMDHIKTHCYVTYSSIDEAVATRNALYNLQWPRNGGRQLIAEYVDPKEVQEKVDGPPQEAPPTPGSGPGPGPAIPQSLSNSAPPTHMAYKPPMQAVGPGQHTMPPLPSQPLPPPPPLPHLTRDRQLMAPKKVEQPVLTLDDLFKKTRTTPRIYYLPLSEEVVAAKLAARARDNS